MGIAGEARYKAGKLFGMKQWIFDEKGQMAREYRETQQAYVKKMIGDLKDRLASGDEKPSVLGNILRQGVLRDEEILLAFYTIGRSSILFNWLVVSFFNSL